MIVFSIMAVIIGIMFKDSVFIQDFIELQKDAFEAGKKAAEAAAAAKNK